jgi:hypothetical protein
MEGYHTSLKNQTDIKLRGGRKADRSKSVYHSKNTVRKRKPKEAPVRKAVLIDLPNSDTILRILRMRTGKKVKEFLHTEFEKRNHPQPQMNIRKDEMPPPPLPPHDSTPTVEQTIPLR